MRTTVTLDPDVEALLKELMREQGVSFKEAVNSAIRAGLAPARRPRPFRTPTFAMGFDADVRWDKALLVAAQLEDDELVRKASARK